MYVSRECPGVCICWGCRVGRAWIPTDIERLDRHQDHPFDLPHQCPPSRLSLWRFSLQACISSALSSGDIAFWCLLILVMLAGVHCSTNRPLGRHSPGVRTAGATSPSRTRCRCREGCTSAACRITGPLSPPACSTTPFHERAMEFEGFIRCHHRPTI